VVSLGQPVLAEFVAPVDACCLVAPSRTQLLQGVGDSIAARQRQLQLGLDPATGFNPLEGAAGVRFEQATGIGLHRSTDVAFDWVDDLGRTYDAVGPAPAQYFDPISFNRAVDTHIGKKGLNTVVVDVTGLRAGQIAAVRQHVASLPSADQARIVGLGF